MNFPTEIKTDQRIFKIQTINGETGLCNLDFATTLYKNNQIDKIWHIWNLEFKRFSVNNLSEMIRHYQ